MRTDEGARTSFLVPSFLSCRRAVQFMPSLLQVQKKKTDVNLSPFVNHFEQKRGNRRMSQKDRQERAETHTYTQKRDRSVTLLSGKRRTKKKKKENGIVKTLNIMTADEPALKKKKKELDFIIPGIPNMTYAHPQEVF